MHKNMRPLTLATPLILALSISAAVAQELAIPERERLQSMSHEEYDAYRKQMRERMDGWHLTERRPSVTHEGGQMEERGANSSYGQGYLTRQGQNTLRGESSFNAGRQQSGAYGKGRSGRH